MNDHVGTSAPSQPAYPYTPSAHTGLARERKRPLRTPFHHDPVMPARRTDDPLVLVPLRLPKSLVDAARHEAEATGATLSDAVRARIASNAVKPLGKPRARRRTASLTERVPRSDPALVRQVAAIGSNLNQIARAANSSALNGLPVEAVTLLAQLFAIEREVLRIALLWDKRGR